MEEELVKMRPEEISLLQLYKSNRKGLGCTLPIVIVFGVIFLFIRFGLPPSYWNSKIFSWAMIGLGIVGVLIIVLFGLMDLDEKRKGVRRVERDLEEGLKKIVQKKVQEQKITGGPQHTYRQRGPSMNVNIVYNLVIDGENYHAQSDFYYKVKPGDTIYFHIAPHSDSILCYTIESDSEFYPPSILTRRA